MEEKIVAIEEEIAKIKNRNHRVQADKAWEVSLFRVISIAIITYIIATMVMHLIGVEHSFLQAVIPTLGYILSTQSLPIIKKWWIQKCIEKMEITKNK